MHEIIPVKMGIFRAYEYTGFPLEFIPYGSRCGVEI
jgi:hypothetical protein